MPDPDTEKNESETGTGKPPAPPTAAIERSLISPIRRVRPAVLRRRPILNEKPATAVRVAPVVVGVAEGAPVVFAPNVVVPDEDTSAASQGIAPESLEQKAATAELQKAQLDL